MKSKSRVIATYVILIDGIKGITMNNSRAGTDSEELMMFPKTVKVYSEN